LSIVAIFKTYRSKAASASQAGYFGNQLAVLPMRWRRWFLGE
jgi:hypothetical protein